MKRFNWTIAVALVACLVVPMRASAQDCTVDPTACGTQLGAGLSTTTVLLVALPITTVGVLIYFIVAAVNAGAKQTPNSKAAELYLRQNQVELAQDLAAGSGPMLDNLAAAIELKAEHSQHFAQLMQQHRKQLSSLIEPTNLTPATAVEFFQSMANIVQHDAVLAPDYQAYLAHHMAQG